MGKSPMSPQKSYPFSKPWLGLTAMGSKQWWGNASEGVFAFEDVRVVRWWRGGWDLRRVLEGKQQKVSGTRVALQPPTPLTV